MQDEISEPVLVPGIEYFARDDVAGAKFFRCEALRCTLTVTSCASRWRQAADAEVEDRTSCTGCVTGAGHAEQPVEYRSAIFNMPFCPRARRGGERMIGNRLGVSAYNRQREFVIGKNSKGTLPSIKLGPRRIGIIIDYDGPDPQYIEAGGDLTADALELVIQTMRTVPGRLAFCAPRGGDAITTAELARRHGPKKKPRRKPTRKPMPRRRAQIGGGSA